MYASLNKRIVLTIIGWTILAVVLFMLIPMLYPAKLPWVYHFYHLVLFGVLAVVYYVNIHVVIPKLIHKSFHFYYVLVFFGLGALTVSLMRFVEITLNLQEEVYKSLYPDQLYIASEHTSYVDYYVFFLTSIVLTVGFTHFLIKKWNSETNKKLVLQELKTKAELTSLKAQINPHFFFNTLNTIYALTEKNIEKSQKAILKLSKMMRFAMNEENNELVDLQEELAFVHNYLDLMSYRLPPKVTLTYAITPCNSELKIAPMILLTFIENCFKHGVSSEAHCTIKITTYLEENIFTLETENAWFNKKEKQTGIGIENTKKRLDILYENKYELEQTTADGKYFSTLKIHLK